MKKINIYTDGACKGNPGIGGWGVLIILEDEQIELSGGKKETTNNQMELIAVIKSLEHFDNKIDAIIYTDSKYVMDGITSWIDKWKKNNWKNAAKKDVKNKELWIELDKYRSHHNVEWHWVKGHSGHEKNEIADLLANRGIANI